MAQCTRPDLSYAVSSLARVLANPGPKHLNLVKYTWGYLKKTADRRLTFTGSGSCDSERIRPTVFVDASFAGDYKDGDTKSTGGHVVFIGDNMVSWRTTRGGSLTSGQHEVDTTLDTCGAEFQSLVFAIKELVWVRTLLGDMGFPQDRPSLVLEDNQAVIALATGEGGKRGKHEMVRMNWVREHVLNGTLVLHYVESEDQLADVMTKALPRDTHQGLCDRMFAPDRVGRVE